MKSFLLENISSLTAAMAILRAELPGQEQPWLLRDTDGDVIAYINAGDEVDGEPNLHVSADLSGRHFEKGPRVHALLQRLQLNCGGRILGDDK
jgi:hypothetical protein